VAGWLYYSTKMKGCFPPLSSNHPLQHFFSISFCSFFSFFPFSVLVPICRACVLTVEGLGPAMLIFSPSFIGSCSVDFDLVFFFFAVVLCSIPVASLGRDRRVFFRYIFCFLFYVFWARDDGHWWEGMGGSGDTLQRSTYIHPTRVLRRSFDDWLSI